MPSEMARRAEPDNFERFTVVVMVPMYVLSATNFTRLLLQFPVPYRIVDRVVGLIFLWILLAIPLDSLNALPIPSLPVISPVVVEFVCAVLSNIPLVTLLAFVDMSICHPRMLVELCQGLFFPALKACFYRGCYAST